MGKNDTKTRIEKPKYSEVALGETPL